MPENLTDLPKGIDLKDEDIFEAMKAIPGYLDITPGDFKEVYRLAYACAVERLSRAVTAQEIMTREVVSVRPDTPLAEVAAAMGRRGISGVPVLDDTGRVVGVISEKDFLTHMGVSEPKNFMVLVASCLQSQGCVALPIKKRKAADLMTSPAVTVGPEASVKEIAAIFTGRGLNRVPVTDPAGRLLGLVSRGDLVRAALGQGNPMIRDYFRKMAGTTQSPPGAGMAEILWSWLGAFLGIGAVAFLDGFLEKTDVLLLIGSFGASAVLIYGAIKSPLAQPRNLVGGHLISAVIGVTVYYLLSPLPWLAAAVAVATSIAVMHATRTLHPPGGATALIFVMGSPKIHHLGYLYVLMPVGAGVAIMLLVALLINNFSSRRRYPEFWW